MLSFGMAMPPQVRPSWASRSSWPLENVGDRLDQPADPAMIPGHRLGYGRAGQLRLAQPYGVQRGQQDAPASVRGCVPVLGLGASNADLGHGHLCYHAMTHPVIK